MGIDALTSALATPPIPAAGVINAPRERAESAPPSETAQQAAPRVVFNPRSHFDASAGVFVMEYRSASTGEVERQFPDENQLRAYANAKKLETESGQGGPAAEPKPNGAGAAGPADLAQALTQTPGQAQAPTAAGAATPSVSLQV